MQPTQYNADQGTSVTGWKLYDLGRFSENPIRYTSNPGDYEETWGDEYLVLSTNGVIYRCTVLKVEYGTARSGTGEIRVDETLSIFRMDPQITRNQTTGQKIKPNEVMGALNNLQR